MESARGAIARYFSPTRITTSRQRRAQEDAARNRTSDECARTATDHRSTESNRLVHQTSIRQKAVERDPYWHTACVTRNGGVLSAMVPSPPTATQRLSPPRSGGWTDVIGAFRWSEHSAVGGTSRGYFTVPSTRQKAVERGCKPDFRQAPSLARKGPLHRTALWWSADECWGTQATVAQRVSADRQKAVMSAGQW